MPEEFVSEKVCNERFNRILDNQEEFKGTINNLSGSVYRIEKALEVFMTGREPILKRLDAIEAQHKDEATEEVQHLKSDPERRKIDRRWRIVTAFTLVFGITGAVVGIANLVDKVQQAKVAAIQQISTPQQTPNP
jgi:hypothetical protein